jgi:D-alanine-D-alanine ligase
MQPRAVILHDAHAARGRADASDVLVEAAHIGRALGAHGYDVSVVGASLDLAALERELEALRPRVAVNLVESLEGRGQLIGAVPALLEALGVPFTGCSSIAQSLTSHKLLAKRTLERAGVATPAAFAAGAPAHATWIVKSLWEHASLGLDDASLVGTAAVPAAIAERAARFGGEWFAEA